MPWRLLLATLILIHALPDFYARYPDLAFPANRHVSKKLRVFINWIRKHNRRRRCIRLK
jgi:hypothetical protein